ncbi:hypothetical protein [Spartinivicinus poritis]|uniref:Uncharacterized protein n=1 Tax=Spartinivicinus poritis TaxID=2994640 RepID=A0ABT5UI38_9GAMM|nr:hypothetical protein [Spartinivicinus sp. A2-2]MDE1466059.1 hypothetical protein [Spartinivicinus sp. A2-2]
MKRECEKTFNRDSTSWWDSRGRFQHWTIRSVASWLNTDIEDRTDLSLCQLMAEFYYYGVSKFGQGAQDENQYWWWAEPCANRENPPSSCPE